MVKLAKNWLHKCCKDDSNESVERNFGYNTLSLIDLYDTIVEISNNVYNPEFSIMFKDDIIGKSCYKILDLEDYYNDSEDLIERIKNLCVEFGNYYILYDVSISERDYPDY